MSEHKFTPGPWHVINNGPHWNNQQITNWEIAYSSDGELVVEHVYEEADARLIASSPTMYDYVKRRAESGDAEAAAILGGIHA